MAPTLLWLLFVSNVVAFQPPSMLHRRQGGTRTRTTTTMSDSQPDGNVSFGSSVPYRASPPPSSSPPLRNIGIALASFTLSISHYIWQWMHPITAVEVLATMQSNSAPLTSVGTNGKPTVIDFWAPWCENCKVGASTLQSIEMEYSDRVNFIMINGDETKNLPLIQFFGVDAIPHLVFVSSEGDVRTALIGGGSLSRTVLRADIDALLAERSDATIGAERSDATMELPYQMYDAFQNRPSHRIQFVERQ